MAHKVTIDNAGYSMQGGRVLVDGVGYDIIKGRTLIGGAGYDLDFGGGGGGGLEDFVAMIAASTIVASAGRSSSSSGTVRDAFTEKQTGDYIFSFCNENFAINRWDGSDLQLIYQSSATEGNAYHSGNNFIYSDDGISSTIVYAAALMCLRVPSTYTQAEADAIMGSIRLADVAGRNARTAADVSLPCAADSTLIAVYASTTPRIGFYSPVNAAAILHNGAAMYYDGSAAWLSGSGTGPYATRGCGLYKLTSA
jgi:hypothetical protein